MSDREQKTGRRVFRRRTRKRNKPQKFVRVHELKCFHEVEERLKAGWPVAQISDFIQQEKKEYTDVTRESLTKTLTVFRETLAKTEILQSRMPERVKEWQKEAQDAVDEVKELAELYKLQKERIQMEAATEKNIKKLFKTTGQEVFVAMKLLQTSAAIKMDYGLVKRDPDSLPQTNVNVLSMDVAARFGSQAVEDVVQDPIARRKVLSLVEKMTKLEADRRKKSVVEGRDIELVESKIVAAKLGG